MIYYVDIDNTICQTNGNDYENAIPIFENIAKINRLWHAGNVVIYWTARGSRSGKNLHTLTHNQLTSWGCKFNSLLMGKPSFDFIIDDKSLKIEDVN